MPEETNGVVGGCKQFECKVIGFPRPSVRWYKDGVNITINKRYKFDYTREGYVTLIIDNVTYKDQGAYECQAENSEGRASTSAYLLVRGHSSELEDEISTIHTMTFERSDLSDSESRLEKETSRSKKRPLIIDEEAVFNNRSQLSGHLNDPSGLKDLIQRLHAETNNEEPDQNNISFNNELDTVQRADAVQTADKASAFSSPSKLQNSNQEKQARKIAGIGESDAPSHHGDDSNLTDDICFGSNISKNYKTSDSPMTADDYANNDTLNASFIDAKMYSYMKLKGNIIMTLDKDRNSPASTSEVTDDSVDAGVVENVTDSSEENNESEINQDVDEEMQHYLDDLALGLKGHDKSRRWTTDSGILSRESSLSSEPDMMGISHDAMVEMQQYLKGKSDVIYENFGKEKNLEIESHIRTADTILQHYDDKTKNVNNLKLKRSESFVDEIKLEAYDDEIIENIQKNEAQSQKQPVSVTENNDQIEREEEKVKSYTDDVQADNNAWGQAKSHSDTTEKTAIAKFQNKSVDNIYQKSGESESHVHESEHVSPTKKNLAFLSDNETHTADVEVIREREIKPEVCSQVESRTKEVALVNESSGYIEAAQPINNNIPTSGTYDSTGSTYATGKTEKYVGGSYSITPDYLNVFPKTGQQTVTSVSQLQGTGRADADKSFVFPFDNDDPANVEKTKDVDDYVVNKGILLSEAENKQKATYDRPESRADEIDTMLRRIEHRSLKILDWSYIEDPQSIINAGKYLIDDNPIVDLTPARIVAEKLQRHHGHYADSTVIESRVPESETIPVHRESLQEIQVEREPSNGLETSTVFGGAMPISRVTTFEANVNELSGSSGVVENFSAPHTSKVISHEVVSQTVSEINRFEDKAGDSDVTEETWTEETEDKKGRSKRGVKEIIREKTKVSKTSEVTEKITVTKEYEKTTIETNGDSDEEGEPYVISSIREEKVQALESSENAQTLDKADVKQAQVKDAHEETSETSVTETSGLAEVSKASDKAIRDKSNVEQKVEVVVDEGKIEEVSKLSIIGQSKDANQECLALTGTLDLVNACENDTNIKAGVETKRAREVHTRIEESEAEILTADKPIVAISKSIKAELSQAATGITQSVVQETVISSEKKSKKETISEFIQETTRETTLLSSEEGTSQQVISAVQETKVEETTVTLDKGLALESATERDTRHDQVSALEAKRESFQEAAIAVETYISSKQLESESDIMKTTEKEAPFETTFAEMKQVVQVETVHTKEATSVADKSEESGVTRKHKASFDSSAGKDFMTPEEGKLVGIETSILSSSEQDIVEQKNLRNKLELEKSVQGKTVDTDAIKIETSTDQKAEEKTEELTEKDVSSKEKIVETNANIVSTAEIISSDINDLCFVTESSTKSESKIDNGISVDVTTEKSIRTDNSEPEGLSATIDVGSSVADTNNQSDQDSRYENSQSDLTQDDFQKEVAEEEVKAETLKKNIIVDTCKQVDVTVEEAKIAQGVWEKEIYVDQQKQAEADTKREQGTLLTTKSDADREKITAAETEQPGTSNESLEKETINEKEVEIAWDASDSRYAVRENVEEEETMTDEFIKTEVSDVEHQSAGKDHFKDTIEEDRDEATLSDISSYESQPIKDKESDVETIESGTLEKKIVKTDADEVKEDGLIHSQLDTDTEKLETDVQGKDAENKAEQVQQLHDEPELKRPLDEKDPKSEQKATVPDEVLQEVIEEVITPIKKGKSESGVGTALCALEEKELLMGEVKIDLKIEDEQCPHDTFEQKTAAAKHTSLEERATEDVNQRLIANAEKEPEKKAKEVVEAEISDEKINKEVKPDSIQVESRSEQSSETIQEDKTDGETTFHVRDEKISKDVTPNVETSEIGLKKEKLSDKTFEEITEDKDKLESLKSMSPEVKEEPKKEKSLENVRPKTEERTELTTSVEKDSVKEEIITQLRVSKPTEKDKDRSQKIPLHDWEEKIEPKLVDEEQEKRLKAGGKETMSKNYKPALQSEKQKNDPMPIDGSDSQRKETQKEAKTKAIDEVTENVSKTISFGENKTEKTGPTTVEVPETQIKETKIETKEKAIKEATDKLMKLGTTLKEQMEERTEQKSVKESAIQTKEPKLETKEKAVDEATEEFALTSFKSFDELDAVFFAMETVDAPNLRPAEEVAVLSLETRESMSPVTADVPGKTKSQTDAEVEAETKPRIWTDCLDVSRRSEEALGLRWKVEGFPPPKVEIYKDGRLLLQDDRITLECTNTNVILEICDLIPSDSGDYAVKAHNSVGDDISLVTVHVTSSTEPTDKAIRRSYTVPAFVVKPTLEISDQNSVSIKCSVEGDPLPEVVWYKEGEALDREDFWRRFMKEGFHHLEVKNPALLDEGQFACRLQNDAGFAVHVFTFRRQGDKMVCSELSTEEIRYIISPKLDLEITESLNKDLMLYRITASHLDPINSASLEEGEIIQVLGTHLDKQWIVQAKSNLRKICYAPASLICPADGVRKTEGAEPSQDSGLSHDAQGSEGKWNVALLSEEQTKSTSKQELGDSKNEQAGADKTDIMPERRKIQKPNIKSAPHGDREVDSPEFHRVLEPKDDIEQQKDKLSDDRSVAPEYNDGTTRPVFRKRLKKVACNLGDTTELVCVVSGNPSPKVLWLKNNRPLKDTDQCRVVVDGAMNMLIFPSVTEDDLGLYTARAMNVNGSVMSSEELTVIDGREPPNVPATPESPMDLDFNTPAYFFQMSSCHVEEGRLARFDCRVVAYPRPDIVWLRDGKVVESGERYKLLNFNNEIYSMLIQNVEIEDTGRYTCWARNKFGEAMTEAYLNVIALKADKEEGDLAPNFLTRFYDQKVTEGVPAEFKCMIEGRPVPAVTWVLNDMEIREGPDIKMRHQDGVVILELKSTKREQAGEYTCHLSNPLGQAKCSATLTVLEDKLKGPILPKFLKRFDHISAREGDEAKFECIVVGEPSPTITWLFDHKPIPESNKRFVITREGDIHTLTVKGVRFEDDGKITCKAYNDEGEVYCSANMYVRESKKTRETPETLITGTSPAGVKPESFDAKHGYVPTFTKRLNDYAAPVGTRAKFECRVMGIPDPDVTWMKDGRVISPGGRYVMKHDDGVCTLIIDNVNAADAGVFTCIASNAAGKSSSLAQLKVGDEKEMPMERSHDEDSYTPSKRPLKDFSKPDAVPTIPYDKPTLLDVRGDAAKLSWLPAKTSNLPTDARRVSYTVESRELPGFEWTKISTGIPGNTYSARNLRPDKEYEFRVRAQNQYGVSEPTKVASLPKREEDVKKLVVDLPELRAPPRLPVSRPIITEMGDETVRLAWRPVESIHPRPHPSVSYRLEAKTQPGTEWTPIMSRIQDTTHYLSELMPDRDYLFRVRAENEFGVSEPTDSLWLPRARRFTGVPVERPQIIELEPHQARLRWQRVNIPAFGRDDEPLLYMLEMEEPPRDWRTIAYDLDDTEYIIDGLKPGHDYRFRVRAKSPAGVISEPSPTVSLYNTMAQSRAPIDRLEVERYEPDTQSLQLSWQRVDIPPFDIRDEPLMYMLEYRVPHISDWRPLVSGIPMTRYRVTELLPDQDYQFRVRALSPYGISQPSPVLPVSYRQLPTAPIRPLYTGLLEITDFEPDGLRLSWRPPVVDTTQPIRYRVERQETPRLDWVPLASGLTDTSYRVTGLHPTRDYKFRVIPEVGGRPYEPTPPVSLSTIPVRPRMHMQEPRLRELGPDSVQLSWPPAEFPVYQRQRMPLYYSLEMMELPSTTWVPVGRRIPDSTYTVTGLRPDHDYKFRVRAMTDFVSSEPSLPVTFYRRPAPSFPHHEPVVKDVSANAILLTWQPAVLPGGGIAAPVTYHIEIQTPPGVSTWTPILANHPSCSARLTDLRPDLDYLVRVRAQFRDILTEPTLPVYIPRRAVPPRLPCDEPYPIEIAPNAVKLQWRSAELPVHINDYSPVTYRVEVQEQPGKSWVTVARGIPHTDFKITNLNPEKDYLFRIRGENDYGLSEPTRPVHIRKRAVAPQLPSDAPLVYDVGSGSAKLSWRPADIPSYFSDLTPIYYTIYIQEPPSKTWRPLVRKIPHTMYHVTGLLPDRDYDFRIQAENEFGASRPTESARLPRKSGYKAPIYIPEIDDFDEDYTAVKLRWKPQAVAPYTRSSMRYQVESWEPLGRTWKPLATGISEPSYTIRGLKSGVDNLYRIRAEADQLGPSEPSVPISVSRDQHRIPVYRPQLHEVEPDSVKLSWQPSRLPFMSYRRPVRYNVETREIPSQIWRPIATELHDTTYRVMNLRPKSEYEFRVRALTDDGPSEPSLPVALYRRPVIPTVRLEAPEIFDVDDDAMTLRWARVNVPAFSLDEEPMTFMIETQRLPDYEWQPMVRGLTSTQHRITGLQPYQDYIFRVRGEYPSGYTAPSPPVPVYRRPIRPTVPITHPEIWEEEPYTAHLQWRRAYIPKYLGQQHLRYRIEMQEPLINATTKSTTNEWHPIAEDVTDTDFVVKDISPKKDYLFRIRAKTSDGELSDPTPPIPYYRSQLPMSREPFAVGEYKPYEYDFTVPNRPYFEHLTRYVPPRMPVEKPELIQVNEETAELHWKPAHVPKAVIDSCNLTYTIEVRTPPSFEWRELVSGLKSRTYKLTNLHPRLDYVFRIRGWNEYGCSEPGLPVSLYRPIRLDDLDVDNEEEEKWEKEWELKFGQQEVPISEVPPKLPMDTPRVTNFMPESFMMSWLPARIPAYAKKTQITYFIEVKEPPSTGWRRFVSGLHGLQYLVEGLSPKQDYEFRVRAETEFGVSDPTLAVMIQRSKRDSLSHQSSMERNVKDDNLSLMATSHLDDLTAGVPPRMPSSKPLATNIKDGSLTLTWGSARIPSYVKSSAVTYSIEMREPSSNTWITFVKGWKENSYIVRNLNSDRDYMFRIKACNEFGVSEPTLPFSLFRNKDDYELPCTPRSRSGSRDSLSGTFWSRRRSSSMDYSRRSSEDLSTYGKIPLAPSFITPDKSTQYFVVGKPARITLQLRGYPLPVVDWFHGDEKLVGDMYKSEVGPGNAVTLEIKMTTHDTLGEYKCFVKNDLGVDVRTFKLRLADPPTILEPPKDLVIINRESGTLECRVDGIPKPHVKWLKDWLPLSESARVKVLHETPDRWSITITNAITKDNGIYTCVAENEAGKAECSARITVEESTSGCEDLNMKYGQIEDHYYVLEEIGRGRHGVVRRVIDKVTGKEYAAKFIYIRNEAQKNFFRNEFECQKIVMHKHALHLHDAYETERRLVLVSELLQGDDLLDWIIASDRWTESEAAAIVKQVLETLQELHRQNVLHLDIKPSNIMMSNKTLAEIKLIDFGLSRWQSHGSSVYLNYGTPEFTSPEQVKNESASPASDAWSVGVLTFILLSGVSPFGQISDKDTLMKVKECQWKFEEKDFDNISSDAKDFISKLLVKGPSGRMSIQDCLNHPWIVGEKGQGLKLELTKLKNFQAYDKLKRELDAVRTTAKLKSLCKMLDNKAPSMEPAIDDVTGEIIFPDSEEYGEFLDEESWYSWHSRYQEDPDAELFPLHDPDFVVRIRSYRRIRGDDGMAALAGLEEEEKIRWRTLKERQLLTDVEMESSPEEEWISMSEQRRKLFRRGISQDQVIEYPLMFRTKLHDLVYKPDDDLTLTCHVLSSSPVTITWYRDDQLLSESNRIQMKYSENGTATLTILNAKPYDVAVYKCVARNKDGRMSCLARLIAADVPVAPGRPIVTHISCKQVFLMWEGPMSNGDSYIQGYRVDYKKLGDEMWTKGPDTIEEYALITGLVPNSLYKFRVSCYNNFGSSPYSIASREVTTKDGGEESLSLDVDMLPLMSLRPTLQLLPSSGEEPLLDITQDAPMQQGTPNEAYDIQTSFFRGSYGEYRIVTKKNTKTKFIMKIVPYTSDKHDSSLKEFNLLRPLSQDNIVRVVESYLTTDKFYIIFERLTGLNVVEYLSLRSWYSEDVISKIMLQVFNALQYLQFMKLVHLNLQPGSVVMATGDGYHVKLTDFTLARKLDTPEGEVMPIHGYPDFIAPEVITQGKVNGAADIWSAGVLAFLLLSGESPFVGETTKETLTNIVYNRCYSSDLYDNASQAAVSFIFRLLKRIPRNRLTVDECLESRWFQPSEKMVRIRQKAVFSTNKLRTFCRVYEDHRLKIDIHKDLTSDLPVILPESETLTSRQPVPDNSKSEQNIETAPKQPEMKPEAEPTTKPVQKALPEIKVEKAETDSKPETKFEPKSDPETLPKVEPETETEPEIKGESNSESDNKLEPELKLETKAKLESKPEAEPEIKPELECKPEIKPELECKHEIKPELECKHEIKPELECKHEIKPELECKHEIKPELECKHEIKPELESKPEIKPELEKAKAITKLHLYAEHETIQGVKYKTEQRLEIKDESKSKLDAMLEPEAKSKTNLEPETESGLGNTPETKESEDEPLTKPGEVKPETKPELETKQKQEAKHYPEALSKIEPEGETKLESETQPMSISVPIAKPEIKLEPEAKTETEPEAEVETKPESKVEPVTKPEQGIKLKSEAEPPTEQEAQPKTKMESEMKRKSLPWQENIPQSEPEVFAIKIRS